MSEQTRYERMGGHETFDRLIRDFYAGVAGDRDLRAMYPEEDLGPASDRLRMFLEQFWGGPRTYSEQRGHPRLRMRHVPFRITAAMRDRWLSHMLPAVERLELDDEDRQALRDYFVGAADFLVNASED